MNIYLCPFCGRPLDWPIVNGITTCENCERIFDSSSFHRVLFASWVVRREHICDIDYLLHKCKDLNEEESDFVKKYLIDDCYNHEDFYKIALDKFKKK